ncbi:MAG: CopG family transcriptional regulator [Chloroflexi bacterium]|nr:CopG family transcriptional regulator [Chloroflexota bacterium]
MATAYIELSDQEIQALERLAQQTGKTQAELLHEAVTDLLAHIDTSDRLDLLQQARGIWRDRDDLPDVQTLRTELDRSFKE